MQRRPFIIGIAGGSSSGKTTVTERLAALTGDEHLSLIELDSYYLDLGDAPIEQREAVNYDHPDAFDWELLNDHLAALANGASVPVPVYDYAQHNRSDQVRMVDPARIIVVDGILVFWDRALRERFDLKIFVDTAADIRLIRRLRRDVAERGRTAGLRDRAVPQHRASGSRTLHRAEQTSRRRDHPGGRPQPPGARGAARPRPGDHARRLSDETPACSASSSHTASNIRGDACLEFVLAGYGRVMIILGLILLLLGFVLAVPLLWTLGIIVLIIGLVLLIAGQAGRQIGGRAHYW